MSRVFAWRARAENGAMQNSNQRTVLATLTPQEAEDVGQLLLEYQHAIVFALEIVKTRRIDAASLPKLLTQDAKAGRAIERIREIFGVSA